MQVLCLQGFLAARKHADRIILLAEMMQHSGCPCFRSGSHKPLAALRRRFHLSATESQVQHEEAESLGSQLMNFGLVCGVQVWLPQALAGLRRRFHLSATKSQVRRQDQGIRVCTL